MNNNPGMINKVLNGINSTLNIANKVVPIYKEAKPLFNTVSTTYKKIKDNGKEINKVINLMKLKNEIKKETTKTQPILKSTKILNNSNYTNINNPKFFI